MAEPEYRIFCVLQDQWSPFSVKIAKTGTVGELKNLIKEEKKPEFDAFAADRLMLYDISVDISRTQYNDLVNELELRCSSLGPKLRATDRLRKVYPTNPPKKMVHILVKPPTLQFKTPLSNPNISLPNANTTPGWRIYATAEPLAVKLDRYIAILRPRIHEFLANDHRPHWVPPGSNEETRLFYDKLRIPIVERRPCLLLHNLGTVFTPCVDEIFQGSNGLHRILWNTSGSGKTRLLFEGLCQHWGFYFVMCKGLDGIGVDDLSGIIDRMPESPDWIYDIFRGRNPSEIQLANITNEKIATNRIAKVILARWIVFKEFIDVAETCNGGVLPINIKRDWLLFQIHPLVTIDDMDPFTALVATCLNGVTTETLHDLQIPLNSSRILGSEFPKDAPFYYILDEAQLAGNLYMGAFTDEQGQEAHPILRPIIRQLTASIEYDNSIRVIVSGTGFSPELFRSLLRSKTMEKTWQVVYDTGDFCQKDAQLAYISRYIPSTYLLSHSGQSLQARLYKWLRGRHRFTARYLEDLLIGPWEGSAPVAPHNLLNAFVLRQADFMPIDGDMTLMEAEPKVSPKDLRFPKIDWERIEREKTLLPKLSIVIKNYLTTGDTSALYHNYEDLVKYGFARFVGKTGSIDDQVAPASVEEPLTLTAIMCYFKSKGYDVEEKSDSVYR